MKLPKSLTTVTPLSRTVAAIVLIALPFIGFIYGMKYQERVDKAMVQACTGLRQ